MIKAFKIRLLPTLNQEKQLWNCANISRFAYNFALGKQVEHFKKTGKLNKISDGDLRIEFTKLKNTQEYKWLYEVSNNVPKQSIKDLCRAVDKFHEESKKHGYKYKTKAFKSGNELTFYDYKYFPKFKCKGRAKNSFYNDVYKIKINEDKVLIEKVGWVRLLESDKLSSSMKFENPRITHDNKFWYLSVGVIVNEIHEELTDLSIGVDLGLKDFAVCSHKDEHYKNINKSKTVKKLKKKLRRIKRQISRKYENNKRKVGEDRYVYQKTNNIKKQEQQVKLIERRLYGIRNNYLHQITNDIVKAKPYRVVVVIQGMMKNRHLSKAIGEQCFHKFIVFLEYKCKFKGIELVKANRFYPSSKTCSCCETIKKDLKLKDRTFNCNNCGNTLNRDKNASINLSKYKVA